MQKAKSFSKADELAITTDTLNIFTNLFLNYKKRLVQKNKLLYDF